MSVGQILVYALIALVIYYVGKKFYLIRTIKQYSPVDANQKVKKKETLFFLTLEPIKKEKKAQSEALFIFPYLI